MDMALRTIPLHRGLGKSTYPASDWSVCNTCTAFKSVSKELSDDVWLTSFRRIYSPTGFFLLGRQRGGLHIPSKILVCVPMFGMLMILWERVTSWYLNIGKTFFSQTSVLGRAELFCVNFIKFRPRHTSGKKNHSLVAEIW